jgi:hypothetical protein
VISKFGKNIGIAVGKKTINVKKLCQKKFGIKKTFEQNSILGLLAAIFFFGQPKLSTSYLYINLVKS